MKTQDKVSADNITSEHKVVKLHLSLTVLALEGPNGERNDEQILAEVLTDLNNGVETLQTQKAYQVFDPQEMPKGYELYGAGSNITCGEQRDARTVLTEIQTLRKLKDIEAQIEALQEQRQALLTT